MTFAYAFSLWFQTVAGTCWWRRSMRPGLRYRATLEGAAHLPLCWMALMSRRRCRESDDGPACRKPCAVSFKDWICKTLEASEIALLYAPKVSPWNNFSPEPFARWNKNFKTKLRSSLLIESSKTQSSKHLVFVGIPISCWPTHKLPQHLAREAEGRKHWGLGQCQEFWRSEIHIALEQDGSRTIDVMRHQTLVSHNVPHCHIYSCPWMSRKTWNPTL